MEFTSRKFFRKFDHFVAFFDWINLVLEFDWRFRIVIYLAILIEVYLLAWTALTSSFQLLVYTDDIALSARRLTDLKKFFIKLEKVAKEVGLQVNEEKTNYLVVSRSKRTAHANQNFTFGEYNFERVSSYNHLKNL